jgi:hypothetical protein
MDLSNSKRILYSASHLSSTLTDEERRHFNTQPGGALMKLNLLRALNVTSDTHVQLRTQLKLASTDLRHSFETLLTTSAQLSQGTASHLDIARSLTTVPDSALLAYAKAVASIAPPQSYLQLFSDIYERQTRISPVGRLYLERIEMFPIGVERGEMVFTVPMAPGESTTISHREWSVSSRGYEDVVQDSLETYSERGVTEKSDSSTATENEVHQSNRLNFGATLSGSYGPVSLTTNLGITSASDERSSVKNSMQKNREVTQKSSARVRQEHKVSMKIETKQGLDETSFKTITNPLSDAVRIDYYKMMRKWRTDLYRYGLR